MKEIKFLLLVLAIAGYTSLFWITLLTDWLVFNKVQIGVLGLLPSTAGILIMAVSYILAHWKDN